MSPIYQKGSIMKNLFCLLIALFCISGWAFGANAEFVYNGSFELGQAVPDTGWGTWGTIADGWAFVQGNGQLRTKGGSGTPWWGRVPYNGSIFVSVTTNSGNTSIIQQHLNGLVIGGQYAVNFAATLGPGNEGSSNLKVYIGSTLIYDVNMSRFGWYTTGTTWQTQIYTANESDGTNPILQFVHTNGTASEHKMCFDKVSVYGLAAVYPGSLDMPIVLEPDQHEYEQFGYNPEYTPNAVTFDNSNVAYIRSRSANPNDTGYVQIYDDGQWVDREFTSAVIEKFPTFERYQNVEGFEGDRIVVDAAGDIYTKFIIKLIDNTYKNVLLYSKDKGLSWQVYELPGGRYDMEHWVGHNTLDRPPLLCQFYKTSDHPYEDAGNQFMGLIQPVKKDGGLVFRPQVEFTNRGMYMTRHAGGSSFAVSTRHGTFVTWSETYEDNSGPGAPTYVAKYAPETNLLAGDPNYLVAYAEPINDRHCTPAIAVDSLGYLHVVTGSAAQSIFYTRSLVPYSVSAGWTTPVSVYEGGWAETIGGAEEGRLTYPSMLIDFDDNIHLVFRSWRKNTESYLGGAPAPYLSYIRKPAFGDWPNEVQLLVVPPYSGYANYYQKLSMDKLGNLFLSYEYYGTEGDYTYPQDYRPAVIVSPDAGVSWLMAENLWFDNRTSFDTDFNNDGYINELDLAAMAELWLKCNKSDENECWN